MTATHEAVVASCTVLCRSKIHPHFAGYLCLRQAEIEREHNAPLKPRFEAFFESYFSVAQANAASPYRLPFNENGNGLLRSFNKNVAGSYAPSSLREGKALSRVVRATGGQYNLEPDHTAAALENLLAGERINAVALSIFMHRDFSFETDILQSGDYVAVFKEDFGFSYTPAVETAETQNDLERLAREYESLFFEDSSYLEGMSAFEPLEADEAANASTD